jgi:crotonobetainyl-CoA:carnitine CoA-transferase CaiB-like acyl-CoA transferase
VRLDPPPLGAHSRELLRSIGLSDARIDALKAQSVVA